MHLAKRIVPVRKSDLGLYMWQDESCQLAKVVYMWQNGSCQLEKVVYMCKTVRASSKKWKDGSGLYIAKRFVPARKTGLGLYMVQRFVPAPKSGLGLYMWQNGLCQLAQVVLVFTFVRASANRLQNVVWFSHLAKPVVPTSKSCFCSYIWQHLSAGFKTWFWPLNFGKKYHASFKRAFGLPTPSDRAIF